MGGIENEIVNNKARQVMWKEMTGGEGWRHFIAYLEQRYIAIGLEECDSLRKLADRNGRLNEIKRIFTFINHDFHMEEVLLREYTDMISRNNEIPEKFNPYELPPL